MVKFLQIATICASAACAGCVTAPAMMPNSKFQLVPNEMQIVRDRVSYNLREPKSAEFLPR